jgi:hypothetical protein
VIEAREPKMVWSFFNAKLGLHHSEDFRGVMHIPQAYQGKPAVMDDVAVAVGYNAFVGHTCCMHTVIQRPDLVSPRIVREAFEYPFVVADCVAVLALVDSTNEAALKFDTKLGFKEIDRIPGGGVDGDLVIMKMLRSECRWLRHH